MKFPTQTLTIFALVLISSSFASAVYYTETSSANVHDYDDSMYLNPDFAPKSDLFYTPFNAYRTYCAASYCPAATKIIQIREAPIKIDQPRMIIIHRPHSYSTPTYYPKIDVCNKY